MHFLAVFSCIMGIVWIIIAICIAVDCSGNDYNCIEFLGKEIKIYYVAFFMLTVSALNFAFCAQMYSCINSQKNDNTENIQKTESEFPSGEY